MSLDHLWAGWRMAYVASAGAEGPQPTIVGPLSADECVFCAILSTQASDEDKLVVWQGDHAIAMLNAFPYASGHVMVMPRRHLCELEELSDPESSELWQAVHRAVAALKAAYHPDGCNLGVNLGRAAGAGIPGHLHVHAVPRWTGDTNFMTSTASTRVLPEALGDSWKRLKAAW
ncbi:MAG: HIT family protein [Acidimicrobiales bacterium]